MLRYERKCCKFKQLKNANRLLNNQGVAESGNTSV
jgi:hypothetical protein